MKNEYTSVTIILSLFTLLTLSFAVSTGMTFDELGHIPAGYTHLRHGDYRLNPESPPLIEMISTTPLLFTTINLPIPSDAWSKADQWDFGRQFFWVKNKEPYNILWKARLPMIMIGIAFLIIIYFWTKELYGSLPAITAMGFAAFTSIIIANAGIASTDLGFATVGLLTLYWYWKLQRQPSKKRLVLTGIALGLALASKHTALYLIPLLAILAWIEVFSKDEDIFQIWSRIKQGLMIIGIALLILLLAYRIFQIPMYGVGLSYVIEHTERYGYLMGEHSTQGWWYYFPLAFLIKSPLPLLLLFGIAISLLITKRKEYNLSNELYLLIPIMYFFTVFAFSSLNIGIRHILIIYPFVFIAASKVANHAVLRWTIPPLGAWLLIGTLLIHPYHLAYFNELVGPDNGPEWLIDSNIDWGQDLPTLKRYMKEKKIDQVILGYYGTDNATIRGIRSTPLKCSPQKGVIAVSINLLKGITHKEHICLGWLKKYEPIEKLGYSIYVYNITESKVDYEKELQLLEEYRKTNTTGTIYLGVLGANLSINNPQILPLPCNETFGTIALSVNSINEWKQESVNCYRWTSQLATVAHVGETIRIYRVIEKTKPSQ